MPGIVCACRRQRFAEKRRKAQAFLDAPASAPSPGGKYCRRVNVRLPVGVAHD
jgi:hypothetical protein